MLDSHAHLAFRAVLGYTESTDWFTETGSFGVVYYTKEAITAM